MYQVGLAENCMEKYGETFYRQLGKELEDRAKRLSEKYRQYEAKKKTAFENYALGILDKDSYQEVKAIYEEEEKESKRELIEFQQYKKIYWKN